MTRWTSQTVGVIWWRWSIDRSILWLDSTHNIRAAKLQSPTNVGWRLLSEQIFAFKSTSFWVPKSKLNSSSLSLATVWTAIEGKGKEGAKTKMAAKQTDKWSKSRDNCAWRRLCVCLCVCCELLFGNSDSFCNSWKVAKFWLIQDGRRLGDSRLPTQRSRIIYHLVYLSWWWWWWWRWS